MNTPVLEPFAVTCLAAAGRQKMTLAWLGFRLEHELVAIEREANDVMTVLAVLAVLVKHLPESP
jgi:hypothetical protein